MASSTAKKKTTSKSAPKKAPAKAAPAKTREPAKPMSFVPLAIVCILLAALTLIGFFTNEGVVVVYFCAFIKGVIGYGFWLFPFAMIWAAVLLFGGDSVLLLGDGGGRFVTPNRVQGSAIDRYGDLALIIRHDGETGTLLVGYIRAGAEIHIELNDRRNLGFEGRAAGLGA